MGAGLGLRLEGGAEVEVEPERVQVLRKNQSLIGAAGQVTRPDTELVTHREHLPDPQVLLPGWDG